MHPKLNDRLVLHLGDGSREILDSAEVYLLEAEGDSTWVRLAEREARLDVRALGELAPPLESRGFLRIHRSYAVNLRRVRLLRRRDRGRDWEIQLEPPVNRVLPVSRDAYPHLLAALEGK
jgi:DNA-binding LytR/AlgR family response regulator